MAALSPAAPQCAQAGASAKTFDLADPKTIPTVCVLPRIWRGRKDTSSSCRYILLKFRVHLAADDHDFQRHSEAPCDYIGVFFCLSFGFATDGDRGFLEFNQQMLPKNTPAEK